MNGNCYGYSFSLGTYNKQSWCLHLKCWLAISNFFSFTFFLIFFSVNYFQFRKFLHIINFSAEISISICFLYNETKDSSLTFNVKFQNFFKFLKENSSEYSRFAKHQNFYLSFSQSVHLFYFFKFRDVIKKIHILRTYLLNLLLSSEFPKIRCHRIKANTHPPTCKVKTILFHPTFFCFLNLQPISSTTFSSVLGRYTHKINITETTAEATFTYTWV